MLHAELHEALAEALAARGYVEPTPVQAAVIAEEAAGRDLIVSAQTGSGKTVAFGLAMAPQLLEARPARRYAKAPLGLVIAPTRELALQVSRELDWLYAKAGARIATCVGGMDPMKERRALSPAAPTSSSARRAGCATTSNAARSTCRRSRVAVLDEADEMLDMGFREDLEQILDATPAERRTLLFSATMPRPIVALAKRYQSDALRIATVGDKRRPRRHRVSGGGGVADRHRACGRQPAALPRGGDGDPVLRHARRVRRLHASLTERGFSAVALSGEHSQSERNQALQALRDRRARVCVATDVAARGIDLPSVSLVIHVELPRDAEALQHRSGRTGRAGRKGTAVLIVPFRAASGSKACCAARGSRRNGSRVPTAGGDPREGSRAAARQSCWRRSSLRTRIGSWPQHLIERAGARGDRRRAGPARCAANARARRTFSHQASARATRDGRRSARGLRRTRPGSAWTSAAATMPTRAGCCR